MNPIYWDSDTHKGMVRQFGGKLASLGFWTSGQNKKTRLREHELRYDTLEAAIKRLTEKYAGFHTLANVDVVSELMDRSNC